MGKKVIAAGHICLDLTPAFLENGVPLPKLFQPGKMLQMGGINIHLGGSVSNTGLGMKLLGSDVTLVGKIGEDLPGAVVREFLERKNASEGLLTDGNRETAYSIVLVPPGIDRIFLYYSGANDSFNSEDIGEKQLQEAALFHFGYPSAMKRMYEQEGEELEKLMKRAKKAGCATSLDTAAVDPASESGKADWRKILEKTLPYVDFFLPSAEEMAFMLNRPLYEEWQQRASGCDITEIVDIEKEIIPLAELAMRLGAGVVLVKCGVLGIYWCTAGEEVLRRTGEKTGLAAREWADKSGFEESFVPERVVSAAGAGDTSIAAFLTAMLRGCPPQECVRLAAAAGACSVEGYESFGTLKSLEELYARIGAGWQKRHRKDKGNAGKFK